METGYEFIEHTADVGIAAYGLDIGEAFVNAARGMFSLIVEPGCVGESAYRDIEVNAPGREELLVVWLNELIYLFDVENILFSQFDIKEISDTCLIARAYGEPVDKTRHNLKIGIKAATYHMLMIEQGNGVEARVLFDI